MSSLIGHFHDTCCVRPETVPWWQRVGGVVGPVLWVMLCPGALGLALYTEATLRSF